MKKKRTKYEEKYLKANRSFPIGKTVWLVVILIVQITLIVLAAIYKPVPQDLIREYYVTVEPKDDGSLDIEYRFVWEALDTSEELTWVQIGMANEHFSVYPDSVSDTVSSYYKEGEEGYASLILDFAKAYTGGEVAEFSFKINQRNMLCRDKSGYFYEFIPGWFNAICVEHYEFRWKIGGNVLLAQDAVKAHGWFLWEGDLTYGGYEKLFVRYGSNSFTGCNTVEYRSFDDSGAYNELLEDKVLLVVFACLVVALLIIAQVYIVDSYVSYYRGRGFLTGYGHHIHIYGRTNPRYAKERDKQIAKSGRGGRGGFGGGCACACACACAGGGRAGCSQKDTYVPRNEKTQN